MAAVVNGHAEIVRLLMGTAVDVNKKDDQGFAPVHVAVLKYVFY
jgi:hypothetical protein